MSVKQTSLVQIMFWIFFKNEREMIENRKGKQLSKQWALLQKYIVGWKTISYDAILNPKNHVRTLKSWLAFNCNGAVTLRQIYLKKY